MLLKKLLEIFVYCLYDLHAFNVYNKFILSFYYFSFLKKKQVGYNPNHQPLNFLVDFK